MDIEDDGPELTVSDAGTSLTLAALDETPGASAVTGDTNAGDDEPADTTTSPGAIGTVTTSTGAVSGLFNTDIKDFGRDGEAETNATATTYSVVLRDASGTLITDTTTGVATTMFVVGDGDGGRDTDEQIFLFRVSDTEIVGVVGSVSTGTVALRITVSGTTGSDPDPTLQVDQILAIEHAQDGSGELTDHDDTETLGIASSSSATAAP